MKKVSALIIVVLILVSLFSACQKRRQWMTPKHIKNINQLC
jgi:hypothetical protein